MGDWEVDDFLRRGVLDLAGLEGLVVGKGGSESSFLVAARTVLSAVLWDCTSSAHWRRVSIRLMRKSRQSLIWFVLEMWHGTGI